MPVCSQALFLSASWIFERHTDTVFLCRLASTKRLSIKLRRVAKLEPRSVGNGAASTGAKERILARISAMAERGRASGAPMPTDAEQQQARERVTEYLRMKFG